MFTEVRRDMHELSEKFSKELKTSKEYQMDILEIKEMTTKLKISLESFN